MINAQGTKLDQSLSVDQLELLANLCDQFESLWKKGEQRTAEDFLRELPSVDQRKLLPRMLALEMELRHRHERQLNLDELQDRFPGQFSIQNMAMSVAASFETKVKGDTPPDKLGRYTILQNLGDRGRIGRGAFGEVFAAHDDDLGRVIAIKVPHKKWLSRKDGVKAYIDEAKALALLDHSNIVPVYDAGRLDDGRFMFVTKFIDGESLAARINRGKPSKEESASIIATVAEALHYAHGRDMVHRDVKPANILIDRSGKTYLADFGLVLQEKDFGKGAAFAGTPQYMSPEQARFEGHRVNGRSDIFSLGVVFYELLAGRRPFKGDDWDNLLEQVISVDPRPLRQIDDTIPRELERICAKAMAKLADHRYSIARDMAEDIRAWLNLNNVPSSKSGTQNVRTSEGPERVQPPDSQLAVQVIPKGLRSFDQDDSAFFLELLPGPRDRDGIPDSLRTWLHRIADTKSGTATSVGVIYGPSGCGKSSLVKAGLLPRLPGRVTTIYLEATATETEDHLLDRLRDHWPELRGALFESIESLRRGILPSGEKILIVLDQFEQWLHANTADENDELIRALRQCDGAHTQCLLLVRDDFWMAMDRFMRVLEIPINNNVTATGVDLFDQRHAKRVLTLFGRAYHVLPESARLSPDQERFIDQAVSELSENGKVIPVRLALFSEMVKQRDWTPSTIKAMGGVAGVGVTYLEESLSGPSAPPWNRAHAETAKAILRALLPEPGQTIKGNRRSYRELLNASGYAERPRDFEQLLSILIRQLRLVSPSDAAGSKLDSSMHDKTEKAEQYYQLTHDYLVPAIDEWLRKGQKRTARGRAELDLNERAALWERQPLSRNLPGLFEWGRFRTLTRSAQWTPKQQLMMRRSGRRHLGRVGAIAATLTLAIGLLVWKQSEWTANHLHTRVLEVKPENFPALMTEIAPHHDRVDPLLRQALAGNLSPSQRIHVRLALLPNDSSQVGPLLDELMKSEPEEFANICDGLKPYRAAFQDRLDKALLESNSDRNQRFRAACALAKYDKSDARWPTLVRPVTAILLTQNPLAIPYWQQALNNVGKQLLIPLAETLAQDDLENTQRLVIVQLCREFDRYSGDDCRTLTAEFERNQAIKKEKGAGAKGIASLAAMLAALGAHEKLWPLLKWTPDPTVRSYLIELMAPTGVSFREVIKRLERKGDNLPLEEQAAEISIKRALILSLGQYDATAFNSDDRKDMVDHLLNLFRTDPDSGIHSACEWVLQQWGFENQVAQIVKDLMSEEIPKDRKWFINLKKQTFVIIGPRELPNAGEAGPVRKISHTYAISTKEVTVEQFKQFSPKHFDGTKYVPMSEREPVCQVNWYLAARYCNWLNVDEANRCYVADASDKDKNRMNVLDDWQTKACYRLPTELEWMIACYAGSTTDFSMGWPDKSLMASYVWSVYQAEMLPELRSSPVGLRKPNDLGIFDMHGNVSEWCHYEKPSDSKDAKGPNQPAMFGYKSRGGSFVGFRMNQSRDKSFSLSSATNQHHDIGFRVVRVLDVGGPEKTNSNGSQESGETKK